MPASLAARSVVRLATASLLVATTACSSDDTTQPQPPPPPVTPRVVAATLTADTANVLAARATVTAEHADSARLIYWADGAPADTTPYARLDTAAAGGTRLVALGLRPATAYHAQVEIAGASGTARSDTLAVTSGALPALLQRLTIATTGTGGRGLTLTAAQVGGQDVYALAFDSAGTIRWYRHFASPAMVGGELKLQRNGHFTLYVGTSTGSERVPGAYVEFTPAGDSVRAFAATPPRYTDDHELWITTGADGQERIHTFTYDHRPTDLTAIGGSATADLAGHQLVRLRADGSTEFEWNAWDHLTLDEWIEPPKPGPVNPDKPDFDHPNSIDFDRDGNYIVSLRDLGQVVKIDAQSGAFLWRLGGVNGQFTFVNDPLNGFTAQHSARILPNGHLLLYDNGTRHQTPESRAVEYALDTVAKTATLVWQYRHSPVIYTPFVGLVQRLASGNTLVVYGMAGHADEVAPDGTPQWEASLTVDGKPEFVYRMVRIGSLYRYVDP